MIRTALSQTYCTPHQLRIREIGKLRSRDRKGAVTKPTAPRFTALVTSATTRSGSPGSILPAVKNRGQNVLNTAQLQQAMFGDYLGGRAARRFAGTLLRLLVTGFLVLAASNNCRMPCSNTPTAFSKAPSCPTRTIATDRRRSKEGGRKTFTGLEERFLAIKRAGSSPTP